MAYEMPISVWSSDVCFPIWRAPSRPYPSRPAPLRLPAGRTAPAESGPNCPDKGESVPARTFYEFLLTIDEAQKTRKVENRGGKKGVSECRLWGSSAK